MALRGRFLGAVLAVGAALAGPASASECAPARLSETSATLPRAWREALEALVAATAREGQPWSCPDAWITLIPPGDRGLAQLEVEDASGTRRRPVASPADVVPLGEAMLARTFSTEPPPPPPVTAAPVTPTPEIPGPPPLGAERPQAGETPPAPPLPLASTGPSLLVDLLIGSRYTGPTRAVLLGPELRAMLGFGRWSVGLLARYDAAIHYLQPVPDQFSLSSVTVGLAGGYRLVKAPVELTLAVEPSLAVVLMGAQRPGMPEPDVDARVDMRLGGRLGMAVPLTERLRFTCALGAEGAPAALAGDRQSRRHALPSLPGYLAGLSVGLELLAIR